MNAIPAGFWLGIIIVAALYGIFIEDYFLFDDYPAIAANMALAHLDASASDWRDAIHSSEAGPSGRPLAMLSFALDSIWGGAVSAIPFKRTNLVIHIVCGLLFLGFLVQLQFESHHGQGQYLSNTTIFLPVIMWLLAPLHVSTVLYPVQRMAQLAALFVLLGLYMYVRFRNRWAEQGASRAELLAAGMWLGLVTLAAVFSKENGILLLWLLPLVEWVFLRGRWAGKELPWLRRLALFALLLPVVLVAGLLLLAPEHILSGYVQREFSLVERLLTQLRVLWIYVGWFVLPLPGQMGFLHDNIPVSSGWFSPATTVLGAIAWIVVLGVAARLSRSCPWLLFGLLFFLIGHSMESSVLALEMVFEHRNYLPSVGLAIVVAGAVSELLRRMPTLNPRVLMLAISLPLFLLLGLRTFTWGDELRLAQSNVRHHPDSPRAQYFLSRALTNRHEQALARDGEAELNDLLAARAALRRMAALKPDSMVAYAALYLLDARWFPGNPEQAAALDAMKERAGKLVLSASEVNGLNAVIGHLLTDCSQEATRVLPLVEALQAAGNNSLDWNIARYNLALCELGDLESTQVLADLEKQYPNSIRVQYLRLAAGAELNDVELMYASVARIHALDIERTQVSRLRNLVAD